MSIHKAVRSPIDRSGCCSVVRKRERWEKSIPAPLIFSSIELRSVYHVFVLLLGLAVALRMIHSYYKVFEIE